MRRGILGLVVLLSTACASAAGPVQTRSPDTASSSVVAAQPPAPHEPRATPTLEPLDGDWTSNSYSMTLRVKDVSAAYGWMRETVVEHGGEITSSNQHDTRANINARLDDAAYEALMKELHQVQGVIASESTSIRDNRSAVETVHRRLQATLWASDLLNARARDVSGGEVEGLMMLRELNERERTSLENQLRSYQQQSELNDVRVSIEPIR